ncbi:MAG: DciA family protein [Nitrospinota bacterium]|nr:DciA family protein [Nitrospinota bacterium]
MLGLLYMIGKQNLNKNWVNLSSVLFESLPENLQEDQKEWLAYHWSLVVGAQIAAISGVERISCKMLYVRVQGSEWLQAIEGLKTKIIQELNSRAGKQLIEKIQLTT